MSDWQVPLFILLAIVVATLNSKCSRADGGDTPDCTITRIC